MPTQNEVTLSIGGVTHSKWQSYDIDSDLLVPADGFSMTLAPGGRPLPSNVEEGAAFTLRLDDELVMTGFIDDIGIATGKGRHSVNLTGRDAAGQLLDCSVPVFSARRLQLPAIVARFVRPLGITDIRIDAEKTELRERVNVEPGDTAWDALQHAAEANGLWPWFEPNGQLVVGGPDYSTPVVANLVQRVSGVGNNVEDVQSSKSQSGRYSEVTVLGQAPGSYIEDGKNEIRATAKDTAVKRYRPRTVVDHEASTPAIARNRARKLIADSRLNGKSITVRVRGHRTESGKLWMPGMRVDLDFELHSIKGVHFLMGRRFLRSKTDGTTTELRFKEDGVWVLDAHPHKRKYRLGRNQVAGGEIVDVKPEGST